MYIGAHVSIAGGVDQAPLNAAEVRCESFQMFTRSPRGGPAPKLTDEIIASFKEKVINNKLKYAYIHTPYYINLASAKKNIRQASIRIIREELERGSLLGAKALMTHLGSSKDFGKKQALQKVIEGLAKVLDGYRGKTQFLIENSAGAGGTIIGGNYDEMATIIKALKKHNVGVCYDTCHAFVSGYDLRTKKNVDDTLKEFDKKIGLEKLVLIHANDAKSEFGSHTDRHEHIGLGNIGNVGFKSLVKHKSLKDVDFILETPPGQERDKDLKKLKKFRDGK